jgi:NADPH-dependent curcumin reductase CurA
MHALGGTGFTAYGGLLHIGQLKDGEQVFVSTAGGAVGSVAAQIAKLKGCYVVGSTGSDDKARWLKDEAGLDAVINYKTHPIRQALEDATPKGLDVYFDNVGGDHLEAAIDSLNSHGRVVLCGMSAQYNDTAAATAPRNLLLAINKRLRLEGMIVSDHLDLREQFVREAVSWIREDKLRYRETVVAGMEHGVDAFLGMLRGENTGKMVVRLDA